MAKRDFRKLAKAAAQAADDKKAAEIVILDIRKESDVADYMVIAGVESTAQLRAVYDSIEDELRLLGAKPLHREGSSRARWLVLDYGGMVVHIMTTEARAFYRLEAMWQQTKSVQWAKS